MVGEKAAWGDAEHLLATAVDLLRVANVQRMDPKQRPKSIEPLPRPGDVTEKKRKADEVAARLLAQRERTRR